MKAKLFIRGMKEPVELQEEEAKAAEALISDSSKDSRTPFSIEGVWSGSKSDMKFVIFPKEENLDDFYIAKDNVPMEEAEAIRLKRDLELYKIKSREKTGSEVYYQDFWLEANGVIKLDFWSNFYKNSKGEKVEFKSYDITVNGDAIIKYQELNSKLKRYTAWLEKNEYIEKSKIESLEKMAKTLSINIKK